MFWLFFCSYQNCGLARCGKLWQWLVLIRGRGKQRGAAKWSCCNKDAKNRGSATLLLATSLVPSCDLFEVVQYQDQNKKLDPNYLKMWLLLQNAGQDFWKLHSLWFLKHMNLTDYKLFYQYCERRKGSWCTEVFSGQTIICYGLSRDRKVLGHLVMKNTNRKTQLKKQKQSTKLNK